MESGAPLWQPDPDRGFAMSQVLARANGNTYADAHRWSITNSEEFWRWAWTDCAIVGDPGARTIVGEDMLAARFFPDAQLNVVRTLVERGHPSDPAVIEVREGGQTRTRTRADLKSDVAAVAAALRADGIGAGDRVAIWTPNITEAMVFALGALSIGAIVSSASPDFAPAAVLDRFGQISPRALLVGSTYIYGGRSFDMTERAADVITALGSVTSVIVLDSDDIAGVPDTVRVTRWETWVAAHRDAAWEPIDLPFDHPGFILFSSGTTGKPKCIVHSAAGVLLKDLSEQRYHLDIRFGDRVCFYTTCGWMMWNWLLMALGTGATVVLIDGHPLMPDADRLLGVAAEQDLTFLGISPKYLESFAAAGVRGPHALPILRTIASTGSPLSPAMFDYVYEHISPDVHLASMSGGTDICGCFVLGVPNAAVYRGEIQAAALGMAVSVFDESGAEVLVGEKGELVCTRPFPSQPLGFWGDDGENRYREAYFARFPGVWAHGDYLSQTPQGGYVIHGRSDATLNPGGIRIGTAEIYRVLDECPDVSDAIAVGQRQGADTRILLFIALREGSELTEELESRIRMLLREQASPRHVPAVIAQVPVVPRTVNGKLAELAVTDIVNGDPVRNTSSLADTAALDAFRTWVQGAG